MKTLVELIKENLLSSIDSDKTIEKIKNKFGDFVINIKKELPQKYCGIEITINYSKYKHSEFESFLNLANYFVSSIYTKENNEVIIIIKPRITEYISDFVYKECKGILYHATTSKGWEFIQKSNALIPKNSSTEWRPKQAFLFIKKPNFDKISLKMLFRQLSNKDKNVDTLLKIDLNKINKKLNFYIDPSFVSNEFLPLYTRETIPLKCISKEENED